ncbi:MAG: flagellar protein FlaG [Bryobacterales bacterium]|nr:flagellar protein FlaG [Bryobacterales bacterium]
MEISSVQTGSLMHAMSLTQPTPSPEILQERREIVKAVKKLNESEFYGYSSELQIAVDRATRRPVVRLVDKETQEVLRQIPEEYLLRMAEELDLQA